jgi:enoyl-CoA hydratase/carnithine racemase
MRHAHLAMRCKGCRVVIGAGSGPAGPDRQGIGHDGQVDLATVLDDAAGSLLVDRDGGVVTIVLHRPGRHNAINLVMWQALARLMPALAADDSVDVVVFRGPPGGPFSAGADISEFTSLRSTPDSAAAYGEAVLAGEGAVTAFPRPTVALVEGFAIGGGSQIALACDLRICEPASRFGITPAKLGIVYGLASTARLVDQVGRAWASYLLFTGELIDAGTALRTGLVHEIVEAAALEQRVTELTATLSSRARVSLTGAKALLERVSAGRLEEDDEVRAIYAESLHSPEYAEGVAAFLAKRAPQFSEARARS